MMSSSCFLANTHKLYSPLPLSHANNDVVPYQNGFTFKVRNLGFTMDTNNINGFVMRCGSLSWMRELEAEMKTQEDEDEEKKNSGMARFRHKCGEGKGVVEMLECLEREAIMGEDVGKEPLDYNRRAQIFDTSSRVFQALKEHNNNNNNDH